MIRPDRDWYRMAPASEEKLAELTRISPIQLPDGYLDLLRFSNGGEGPLPVQPLNLCLYPVEEVIQVETEGTFKEHFPGLFVIGGNGGGEAIALDARDSQPWPVVSFDMTNIEIEKSVLSIASDFNAFADLIGLEAA
jgi:hypothetical protein